MASEYHKWVARDVKPREAPVLTKAEKRRNWWYYYKYHVVIGLVLLGICVSILCSALGVGQRKPDYSIAWVGTTSLSDEAVSLLQERFAALGKDENGDGEIIVQVNQYVSYSTGDSDSLYFAQAARTQLIGDIESCDSYFFLLEDVNDFQLEMHVLCRFDGSLPADDDFSAENMSVYLSDCPALGQLPEELSCLSLGRRGFWSEKTTDFLQGCEALWAAVTEGSH